MLMWATSWSPLPYVGAGMWCQLSGVTRRTPQGAVLCLNRHSQGKSHITQMMSTWKTPNHKIKMDNMRQNDTSFLILRIPEFCFRPNWQGQTPASVWSCCLKPLFQKITLTLPEVHSSDLLANALQINSVFSCYYCQYIRDKLIILTIWGFFWWGQIEFTCWDHFISDGTYHCGIKNFAKLTEPAQLTVGNTLPHTTLPKFGEHLHQFGKHNKTKKRNAVRVIQQSINFLDLKK